MLVIRKAQLEALGEAHFEDRVRTHVQAHFPEEAKALGTELDSAVRRAIRRARTYGFSGSDVVQFVDLAVLLGEGFEDLPWARAVLHETPPERMSFRAIRLYEGAIRHLRYMERQEGR
jgi:hypothetical protein